MKKNKPQNESEASWVFEPMGFAYSTGVADEHNNNKHFVRFLQWTRRVSLWLFWEGLVNSLFQAEWKTKILKKTSVAKLQAMTEINAELEELWTDNCHCFLERKIDKPDALDRMMLQTHCMHPRKAPGAPLPVDLLKPAAIVRLEDSFTDAKTKLATHVYNKIPIYNQHQLGRWVELSWEQRDQIPFDLVQTAEFTIQLTDTGKGYAKLAMPLRSVYLVGKSPITPPTFAPQPSFTVEFSEKDTVFQELIEAQNRKRKVVEEGVKGILEGDIQKKISFEIPSYEFDE